MPEFYFHVAAHNAHAAGRRSDLMRNVGGAIALLGHGSYLDQVRFGEDLPSHLASLPFIFLLFLCSDLSRTSRFRRFASRRLIARRQ